MLGESRALMIVSLSYGRLETLKLSYTVGILVELHVAGSSAQIDARDESWPV
jgi:hypothetical protein